MSFKKELEVMLHQMTCRVPHPTNYDFFCEYRDVEIPKTADSIINLVEKEVISENEIEDWKEQPEGVDMSYDFAVCRRAGRNKLRAEQRNKLRGEVNE